jgi:hypothetical protein
MLSKLLLLIPTRQGGLALRSLYDLRSRAYTAGCVDAERIAVSLTAGPIAAGTVTLQTIPFADALGFSDALSDVLQQAATADSEATERYLRLPLWKRTGARGLPPDKDAVTNCILSDCASVLARNPYWSTDSLKLQHNISDALETATFENALDPPIPPGCSRSPETQSSCNRLAALSMKGVSAWFRTVPADPSLVLLDHEFTDSVRYTLGHPRVPKFLVAKRCPQGAACTGRGKAPVVSTLPPPPALAVSACPVPPHTISPALRPQ